MGTVFKVHLLQMREMATLKHIWPLIRIPLHTQTIDTVVTVQLSNLIMIKSHGKMRLSHNDNCNNLLQLKLKK
jgi:hypothetical protein